MSGFILFFNHVSSHVSSGFSHATYVKEKDVTYSKVSIIKPGCSRLLEFEKKDSTGRLIQTFSKNQDQDV